MPKKRASKLVCLMSIITAILLATVSFGSVMWSYLITCSHAIDEVTIGLFQDGVSCYGTTTVEPDYDAGVIVFLQTIDEEGDWVTVTAWEDVDNSVASVYEEYPVDPGSYRLWLVHKAYDPEDHSVPLEIHDVYSDTLVIE